MKCPPINLYSYKAAVAMALWIALECLTALTKPSYGLDKDHE